MGIVGRIVQFCYFNCRKDTYGVFSEPVDPNEVSSFPDNNVPCLVVRDSFLDIDFVYLTQLPDYHEIIEHPMDFGTLRRKLDSGLYLNLEQLEV